jgi:hypothetical protein
MDTYEKTYLNTVGRHKERAKYDKVCPIPLQITFDLYKQAIST